MDKNTVMSFNRLSYNMCTNAIVFYIMHSLNDVSIIPYCS